jgi:hypothetical protein
VKAKKIIIACLAMILLLVAAWFLFFRNPIHTSKMSESKPNQYGFQVGSKTLGWSSHGDRDGYIYMRDVEPSGNNQPLWEFALTPKRHFFEISRSDLKGEFYGMNDPRGSQIFGTAWNGAALLVPEGQMFFARLTSNPSTVYVIKLAKQTGHAGRCTLQAEYRVY